jgi:hypothetical protein
MHWISLTTDAYALPSPLWGEGQVENPARGGGEGVTISLMQPTEVYPDLHSHRR